MSNHLAIATVTATLARVLQEAFDVDVPGTKVTTQRPDTAGSGSERRANVYLYQVTPNAFWRNSDLPTRADNGRLMQKPRAALDLHYLLTFYGDETKHEPQRMLGSAVRLLHSQPLLTRPSIRKTLSGLSFLSASNLAEDIELVKLTPTSLSLEELSKLWAVFFQTQYTLSATYQGSVVLIETDETPTSPLPVLERNVYTVQFRSPVVEEIKLDAPNPGPITTLSNIVIKGRALRGDVTQVSFNDSKLPPLIPTAVADTELKVTLPVDLRAGVQGLQVVHQFLMGSPPSPHRGFESNVAPFVLAPLITHPGPPTFVKTATDPQTQLIDGQVTVKFSPNVGKPQRVRLLLNEFQAPNTRAPFGYVFAAPRNNNIADPDLETDTIVFEVKHVAAAVYLVRVQVDGAESPLQRDTTDGSPTFNQFIGPRVTIV